MVPIALVPGVLVAIANGILFRDPRKIFYTQERVGLQGRPFRIYKFRTMNDPKDSTIKSWSSGDDALRVTPFGRFLRSTHLDELPQLINILRGDMSLIGPRPEMREIEDWANNCVPGFEERLAIKPGITGFAQIIQGYTGRDAEAYSRKLELNQHYLSVMSFKTDAIILWRTVVWVIQRKGWNWQPEPTNAAGPQPIAEPAVGQADRAAG